MMTLELVGYRAAHAELLRGHWLTGELISPSRPAAPGPAPARTLEPAPPRPESRVLVAPDLGFVRYLEISWVSRRARLEIGYAGDPDPDRAAVLLGAAVRHAFGAFRLRRLHGWVTPAAGLPERVLAEAGFVCEARVEEAGWYAGAAVERQIWGCLDAG